VASPHGSKYYDDAHMISISCSAHALQLEYTRVEKRATTFLSADLSHVLYV